MQRVAEHTFQLAKCVCVGGGGRCGGVGVCGGGVCVCMHVCVYIYVCVHVCMYVAGWVDGWVGE